MGEAIKCIVTLIQPNLNSIQHKGTGHLKCGTGSFEEDTSPCCHSCPNEKVSLLLTCDCDFRNPSLFEH